MKDTVGEMICHGDSGLALRQEMGTKPKMEDRNMKDVLGEIMCPGSEGSGLATGQGWVET